MWKNKEVESRLRAELLRPPFERRPTGRLPAAVPLSERTITGQSDQTDHLRRFLVSGHAARAHSDSFKPISQGGLEDE
jgi:hypothetical protein